MGGGGSAPTPPDPVATAQAQGAMNAETARTQAALNRVNQYTPDGSVTYSQRAPTSTFDETGYNQAYQNLINSRNYQSPNSDTITPGTATPQEIADLRSQFTKTTPSDQWSMQTTLSPENQRLYDLSKQAQLTYSTAANDQLRQVQGILSNPFTGQPYNDIGNQALGTAQQAAGIGARAVGQPWRDPSGMASNNALQLGAQNANMVRGLVGAPVNTDYNAIRQQAINAANSRLAPQFKEQESDLRSRLLSSGITEGSEMWDRAYKQMNQAQNDSRQQTLLNAENLAGQAIQQTGALRGIPLNEAATAAGIYSGYGSQADQALAHAAQSRQVPLSEAQILSGLAGNQGNLANQQLQQALALRTQPLNEAQALLTGSAVQSPMLQQVPQTQVAPTDYLGAVNSNYAAQMSGYNSQNQRSGAALGGGAGLLGALGGAAIKYLPWGKIF